MKTREQLLAELNCYISDEDGELAHQTFLCTVISRIEDDLAAGTFAETNNERYAREARTPGTQANAETRGDDLGESPDF